MILQPAAKSLCVMSTLFFVKLSTSLHHKFPTMSDLSNYNIVGNSWNFHLSFTLDCTQLTAR